MAKRSHAAQMRRGTVLGSRRTRQLARPIPRWLAIDLLTLLCLAIPALAIFGYIAATPPTRAAFGVADAPDAVIFRNYYGVEQNAAGPYRWAKPGASISIPLSAPATYAVTLTLQDSPVVPAPRLVTIYANGEEVGKVALGTAPQQYRVVASVPITRWAGEHERMLHIETDTTPFVPSGDARQLGPILMRVELVPVGGGTNWPAILGGAGALLLGVYILVRLLGLRSLVAAELIGPVLLGVAIVALIDRSAALYLAYSPAMNPFSFALFGGGVFLLFLPSDVMAMRFRGVVPHDSTAIEVHALGRLLFGVALAMIVALGLGLRLYHLHHLSFWLDEAATLNYSRYSWPRVLGFEGVYSPHPPLYYALVKLLRALTTDVGIVRLFSALTGAATVGVLAALVARLASWRAALVAALLLAVSPLHIWYSQEARMYAPVVLLVAVSYLALVTFAQSPTRTWAIVYGVSVALSLYTDYSAVYGLAPQVFSLGLLTWRWRRQAAPIWIAGVGAVCAFLPWVPNIFASISSIGRSREDFLGASPDKVVSVALSSLGMKNRGSYLWGPLATFWSGSNALYAVLILAIVTSMVIGALLLARRAPLDLAVALGLALGTFATAIVTSLVSPGFAERTVLAATLGWPILLGAAAASGNLPRRWAGVTFAGVALTLIVSGASLRAFYAGASKEDYRALASATNDTSGSGVPVITAGWTEAAIIAYYPALRTSPYGITTSVDQFWWAYGEYSWDDLTGIRTNFDRLGFRRLLHQQFSANLFLDFYSRQGTLPAGAVPLNLAATWQPPQDAGQGHDGVIRVGDPGEVTIAQPGIGQGTYLLAIEMSNSERGQVTLRCLDAAQATLFASTAVATEPQEVQGVALCPAGTSSLTLTVHSDQPIALTVGTPRLWRVATTGTAATR